MSNITFTNYYILILLTLIFLNLICPFLKIYLFFVFSIKQITENFQIWRLFTNYLIKPSKKVNIGTLISLLSLYIDLYKLEQKAKEKNKYSKFIMIIFLQCTMNALLTFILFYAFDIKESRSLIYELTYSFSAIASYNHPNDRVFISYIPVRNKYTPVAILISGIISNADISIDILKPPLIGYLSGFIFCFLTKKLKVKYIPSVLKQLLKEPSDKERKKEKKKREKTFRIKRN